ncbi:MAG: hypothetical protein EZS28_000521 [Streblomastix strix]|uniref:Uncharacterized protein n=1 Tax=Streblomastix strix TaxID=222440 RepID=A0A5J4X9H4_9EUKA|nr:MAG: hypothetical protein EZS28_000521 [Streblomastix strix]
MQKKKMCILVMQSWSLDLKEKEMDSINYKEKGSINYRDLKASQELVIKQKKIELILELIIDLVFVLNLEENRFVMEFVK